MQLWKARNGHEAEFLQAVGRIFSTLEPVVFENTLSMVEENILARITEPGARFFRVPC